ncbi:hypothetical protein ACQ4LE_002438 [Meloidogyne hapla]
MKSENKYKTGECKCFQDFPLCLFSIIIYGKCTKEITPTYNYFTKPCKDIYLQCSQKKNDCEIGACGCFKSMIDCMLQNKCKQISNTKLDDLSNKHVRASNNGFNEFFEGFFGDKLI